MSAGEASGDAHAAALVRRLREQYPGVVIEGIAGPAMRQAGCQSIASMGALNVMGFSEVVRALPRIRRVRGLVLEACRRNRPDVAILVDFPGFHMRLGESLRRMGIPVIQYIAPKLWAWGQWRVRRLRRSQDRIASILPFEREWFAKHGIEVEYVGNPSAYACRQGWNEDELRRRVGAHASRPLVALLPGSRPQELERHLPLLVELARRLQARMDSPCIVVPRADSIAEEQLAPLAAVGARILRRSQPGFSLRGIDAAVAVSGTATLELALWGVPTVLVYRAAPLTALLARHLLQLRCVGLANLLLGEEPVMPELLQENCTVDKVMPCLEELLLPGSLQAERQRQAFAALRSQLGNEDPACIVAQMAGRLARA